MSGRRVLAPIADFRTLDLDFDGEVDFDADPDVRLVVSGVTGSELIERLLGAGLDFDDSRILPRHLKLLGKGDTDTCTLLYTGRDLNLERLLEVIRNFVPEAKIN